MVTLVIGEAMETNESNLYLYLYICIMTIYAKNIKYHMEYYVTGPFFLVTAAIFTVILLLWWKFFFQFCWTLDHFLRTLWKIFILASEMPKLVNKSQPRTIRERNSNRWWKLNRYLSMIWVVFSIGIEAGGTKRVATSIPLVCFSPDVIHRRPVQAVHLLAESLYFYSRLSRRWIIVRVHEKVWKKNMCLVWRYGWEYK